MRRAPLHQVESLKHVFAVRTAMGDPGTPDHRFRDMSELLGDMLNSDFAESLRSAVVTCVPPTSNHVGFLTFVAAASHVI